MKKIRAAIIGYGNIGQSVYATIKASKDFELAGIVRRNPQDNKFPEIESENVVSDIGKLENVDVAILCTPTRKTPEIAENILSMGINTVDSYDIHTGIWDLKCRLEKTAKKYGSTAIISAGWDPGSDSVVRTLMQSLAPKGITYTNFGPGMSMGHTVAAKAIKGVKKALSMTIPLGTSVHRRMVYVEIEDGFDFDEISKNLKADDYFAHDETHVIKVDDVDSLIDMGHGVNLTRKGVSGNTQNQLFEFNMRINNPALTAQVLVNSARASLKQQPGAYTLIEIPVIDLLYGEKEDIIKNLV